MDGTSYFIIISYISNNKDYYFLKHDLSEYRLYKWILEIIVMLF